MRHLNRGRKLKRTSSHKKALLRNLATSLFEHKKISTTEAKAKELRPYAEKLITKAKHALMREKQGLLPEGQTVDIHNRRMVYRDIKVKAIVQELFDTIAPLVEERPGGYTRIIKTGQRRGDGSKTAIIELVDWSAPQDGATSFKSKKKAKSKAKVKKVATEAPVAEEKQELIKDNVEETTTDIIESSDEVENVQTDNIDVPNEEVKLASEEPKSEVIKQEVTETKVQNDIENVAEEPKIEDKNSSESENNEETKQ